MKTAILTAAALAAVPAFSQTLQPVSQQPGAPTQTVNGQVPGPFGYFRCGTPDSNSTQSSFLPPSDCSATRTVPDLVYSPANLPVVQIPVVFHVIRTSSGAGNVPDSRVNSQIDILNEDYRALPGTPGAPGTDAKVQFVLATTDPSGAPTTGINRYNNDAWYNDSGSYWNTIAWDPNVFLNIHTLGAPQGCSNILGYVPFLPRRAPAASAATGTASLCSTQPSAATPRLPRTTRVAR